METTLNQKLSNKFLVYNQLINVRKVFFLFWVMFCLASSTLNAQTNITLDDAISLAKKNNLSLKNEQLKAKYQEQLKGTYLNLPETQIGLEGGRLNGALYDNAFSVNQGFSFPTVYARQKNLLNQQWQTAVMQTALAEAELVKMVQTSFNKLLLLDARFALLQTADSLFADYLKKANIRYEKGAANLLETAAVGLQSGQVNMQLKTLLVDRTTAQLEFQLLLNTTEVYQPLATELKFSSPNNGTETLPGSNLALKVANLEIEAAKANFRLEKAHLLPDFNLGLMNQTFQGVGPDDIFYPLNNRFNSFQVGLGIPLFFGSKKAQIKAANTSVSIAENQLSYQQMQLQQKLSVAWLQYRNSLEMLQFFEENQLPNVETIRKLATQQYQNGAINFMEWVMLVNQSTQVESTYLDLLNQYNETIIEINFLTNN